MKCLKKLTAILAVSTLLLSSVTNAATVLVNEGKVNMRAEALATNSARLTEENGYNPTWPGTHMGSHYAGVTAPWAYSGAYTIDKVFGAECDDLLFTDYSSVSSVSEMLMDPQIGLTATDIAQHNGYLFVLCNGYKVSSFTDRSEFYQYGNGKTMTYSGVERTDRTGADSYLYVFDISRGAHYSEALVGKWHHSELGLGCEVAPRQIMQHISVDDDYIYITITNGQILSGEGTVADNYDRFLAVFRNNFSRENPEYETGTNKVKAPQRAEDPEVIATYPYGAKQIYDQSAIGISSDKSITTRVINGIHIAWYEINLSMTATTSKTDTMFYLNEVTEENGYAKVEDTKIHYGLAKNTILDNATTAPITSILQYSQEGTWVDVNDAVINRVVNDGDIMYFLVSYKKTEAGKINCYHRIYVTDWSNPLTPKNLTMYEWMGEDYSELLNAGTNITVNDFFYVYDGYIYVSGAYGITILKIKDDTGNYNINKVSYLPYGADTLGVTNQAYIVAVGNYLVLYDNYGQFSAHWGKEYKLLLSEDKTEIVVPPVGGIYYRKQSGVLGNGVEIYGNRVYIPTSPHATGFALTGMVEVINFEKAAPLELSVEPVGDVVTVPYKLCGKAFGVNAVLLTINGEEVYVDTTAGEGNYKVWEYEITETGTYEIDAVGAVLKGFPNEKTKEHISFTATVAGDIDYSATYSEEVLEDESAMFTVNPSIRNNNFGGDIMATPAVGVYSGTTLVAFVKGEKVLIEAGADIDFAPIEIHIPSDYVEYSARIFLLGGVEDITPLTPAVTIKEE